MKIDSKWLQDSSYTDRLVNLFTENVDSNYISYGEMLCERATTSNKWSERLKEVLRVEIFDILSNKTESKIACSFCENNIVGFAIVNIKNKYAFLEDIVVDFSYRNKGTGKELTNFIEKELANSGIKQIFLESGINNHHAHRFFENRGYTLMAKVMSKTL